MNRHVGNYFSRKPLLYNCYLLPHYFTRLRKVSLFLNNIFIKKKEKRVSIISSIVSIHEASPFWERSFHAFFSNATRLERDSRKDDDEEAVGLVRDRSLHLETISFTFPCGGGEASCTDETQLAPFLFS